ncbi:hypothetical protein ACPCBC_33400 [Streptomyces incarnatus]|nr:MULTISPECIES: hypothetical protein [Streptomyces]WKE73602.1 hypothetical protein QHG49_33720 [Streptomyces sp. WP-1]
MEWSGWIVFLIAVVVLLAAAALVVQAKRRSGTVIAMRSGRGPGGKEKR